MANRVKPHKTARTARPLYNKRKICYIAYSVTFRRELVVHKGGKPVSCAGSLPVVTARRRYGTHRHAAVPGSAKTLACLCGNVILLLPIQLPSVGQEQRAVQVGFGKGENPVLAIGRARVIFVVKAVGRGQQQREKGKGARCRGLDLY